MLRYLADPAPLLGLLLAVAVGFAGHNLAQAWTARLLGDPTAVHAGFGRLDAPRQLDVLGVVAAVLTVFGWGFTAEVPMDARPRHRPRAVVSLLAGPVFLLVLTGVLCAAGQRFLDIGGSIVELQGFEGRFLQYAAICSAGLFVTSCIPIPPVGLGRALWLFVPAHGGWGTARYRLEQESLGRLIVFAILMIPIIFTSFPNPVADLALSLAAHLSHVFHGG